MKKNVRPAIWGCILILCFSCSSLHGQALREWFRNALQKRATTAPEFQKFSLNHDGKHRSYLVHVPKNWDRKERVPLVLLFHGGGGGAAQALESYGLAEKADKEKFLLVAPNGTGFFEEKLLTWNVFFGFGFAQKNNVDDLGFVKKLIEKLEADYPLDSARMYATGISNGAIFCHWLAAQSWNRLAAIAPVVGAVGGKVDSDSPVQIPSLPQTPVSVLAINGFLDDHIPYEGGIQRKSIQEPRYILSASDTLNFWVTADGCNPDPVVTDESPLKATKIRYSGGKAGTEVIQYLIRNQGHAWPGGKSPRRAADQPSPDFIANDIMWEFFKAHPRR